MRCSGKLQSGGRCHRISTSRYCWQHQQSGGGGISKFSKPTKDEWDIYGKSFCPYTQGALKYLGENSDIKINFYDITKLNPPLTTQEVAKKLKVNHNSVPMIFDPNNKFVGGFNELKQKFASYN